MRTKTLWDLGLRVSIPLNSMWEVCSISSRLPCSISCSVSCSLSWTDHLGAAVRIGQLRPGHLLAAGGSPLHAAPRHRVDIYISSECLLTWCRTRTSAPPWRCTWPGRTCPRPATPPPPGAPPPPRPPGSARPALTILHYIMSLHRTQVTRGFSVGCSG